MGLPRPTNTGALVSAVLVGVLAVAANLYIRFAPKLLTSENTKTEQTVDTSEASDPGGKATSDSKSGTVNVTTESILPTPSKCLAELGKIDVRSQAIINAAKNSRSVSKHVTQQLQHLNIQAEQFCQLVVLDAGSTPDQKRKARLAALTLTFRVARLASSLRESFWKVSKEVIANGDATDAARAAGLQVVMRINFETPNEKAVLTDLTRFTQRFPSTEVGAEVYMLIAKELDDQGHGSVAKSVLKQGSQLYKGPAASRLINRLIDQDDRRPHN